MEPVSRTAQWTAAARSLESQRSDRLFNDPYADRLAGSEGPQLLARYDGSGTREFLAVRTRYFDDVITRLVSQNTIRQVVMVAAGMDTRAWRLPVPAGVSFYELDRPPLLDYKATQLDGEPLPPGVSRRAVATDLREDWHSELAAAGFDPGQPTLWVAEGLWFFLTEDQARTALQRMRALSAPGSRLVTDFAGAATLTNPFAKKFLTTLAVDGAPWKFGTDTPDAFLDSTGWTHAHVRQPGQDGAHYGRWPHAVPEPNVKAPRWFLCVADAEPVANTNFHQKVIDDVATAVHALTVSIGHRLGLYAALKAAPLAPDELAKHCCIDQQYVEEWLDAQHSAGYVTSASSGRYTLTSEQSAVLADRDSETFAAAVFPALKALYASESDLVAAYRNGTGVAWDAHDAALDESLGAYFLPGYRAHLVEHWIPALTGIDEKLRSASARVADVGCGVGHAAHMIAAAYPKAEVVGLDYSAEAIRQARESYPTGTTPNLRFEQVTADSFAGGPYDLITSFNVVHDLGDPDALARQVAKQLVPGGSWMIVEPNADPDPVKNDSPPGRLFMALSSVMCLPAARAEAGHRPLGNHAGGSQLQAVAEAGGFTDWRLAYSSPVSAIYEARIDCTTEGTR